MVQTNHVNGRIVTALVQPRGNIRVEVATKIRAVSQLSLEPRFLFLFSTFCPACSGSSHDGVASQRDDESNPSSHLALFC